MSLGDRARRWRAQRRRTILFESFASSVGLATCWFVAVALLDRWAALAKPARIGAFAAGIIGCGWLLVVRLWRPWRALTWDDIFNASSARWPESRPYFSSAWALRAKPSITGTSEALRQEHLARADRVAAEQTEKILFKWSPSSGVRRLAIVAVTLLAAQSIFGDRSSWSRAVAPWRDAALDEYVAVEPGDARIDWGAGATVFARLKAGAREHGLTPGSLVLESRTRDERWQPLGWTRFDRESAERRFDSVSADIDYRMRWRDLVGRSYRLEPVPPPRWAKATAVVKDVRGERRFELGKEAIINARKGDWIAIEAQSDQRLASATLRIPEHTAGITMNREVGQWRGGFLAQSEGVLSFELVGVDGRRDPSPPTYTLSITIDAPPTAELLSPQVALVASLQEVIPVTYALRDDSAVSRAALIFTVDAKAEVALPLPVPAAARTDVVADFSWALTTQSPGSHVEFWIEVWDDAVPAQRGVSEKGTIEIVNAAADHAAALSAREAADANVEKAAAAAEAARDAARRGDLAASRKLTEELRAQWKQASAALKEWGDRSSADSRGDPGIAQEAQRSAEEFEQAGQDGLPAAENALAKADSAAAAREQDALAQQARGVQKSMREGAGVQALQDHSRAMSQAGQTSEGLAAQAEALAARGREGTVTGAELEKLEAALSEIEGQLESLRRAVKAMPEISAEEAEGGTRELPLEDARQSAAELRHALQSGDVKAAASAARKLAERLKTLAKTLDSVGQRAAQQHGRHSSEAASRVRRAWQDAVDAQTTAVEAARKIEEDRLAELLARQREMLKTEAAGFSAAAAAAGVQSSEFSSPFAEIARSLAVGDAAGAANVMRGVSAALKRDAATAKGLSPAARALAADLQARAARLESGPSAPGADSARSAAAAGDQRAALAKTQSLRAEVSGAAKDGYLSGRVASLVDQAIAEQGAGEAALTRGDSGEGLKRAEAALAILQSGDSTSSGAESAAGGAQKSMGAGSSPGGTMTMRAGGSRGRSGLRFEHVRLPSANDYQPPRELREELQKSLHESRPAAFDPAIKEYFKRLSR